MRSIIFKFSVASRLEHDIMTKIPVMHWSVVKRIVGKYHLGMFKTQYISLLETEDFSIHRSVTDANGMGSIVLHKKSTESLRTVSFSG